MTTTMLSLARQLSRSSVRTSSLVARCVSAARPLSTAPEEAKPKSRYAIVDHSDAYEEAMRGLHGKQLQLAHLEGAGKDDDPFDPFLEEEEEERLAAEAEEEDEGEEEEGEEDDDDDELPVDPSSPYKNDGSVNWKKSQIAAFRAGAPGGGMFAVVELAGSQHKVTVDDLLALNVLKPVELYKVGSVHTLKDVMLVGSSHVTMVGMPYVSGAEVDVMVEEITQDGKVIVFKKKRRKNYRRKNGHRRELTLLRVLDVRPPKEFGDHKHVQRENPVA